MQSPCRRSGMQVVGRNGHRGRFQAVHGGQWAKEGVHQGSGWSVVYLIRFDARWAVPVNCSTSNSEIEYSKECESDVKGPRQVGGCARKGWPLVDTPMAWNITGQELQQATVQPCQNRYHS